jgi:DHA2 family multidrug resistance protein
MVAIVRQLAHARIDRHTALVGQAGAPWRERALALIDGQVHHQALLLAYGDAFLWAGSAMLLCAAGGLMLRKDRR